jgi:hypothetical protein
MSMFVDERPGFAGWLDRNLVKPSLWLQTLGVITIATGAVFKWGAETEEAHFDGEITMICGGVATAAGLCMAVANRELFRCNCRCPQRRAHLTAFPLDDGPLINEAPLDKTPPIPVPTPPLFDVV